MRTSNRTATKTPSIQHWNIRRRRAFIPQRNKIRLGIMTVVAVDFAAKAAAAPEPTRLECAELLYLGEALAAKIPGSAGLLTAWQAAVGALMDDDLPPWHMEGE